MKKGVDTENGVEYNPATLTTLIASEAIPLLAFSNRSRLICWATSQDSLFGSRKSGSVMLSLTIAAGDGVMVRSLTL